METYQAWKALITAGDPVSAWQKAYVYIYQAFLEKDRWKQYLNGVGTTLYVTAMALILGVILGMTVAIVRAAHDQQRRGRKNPLLGVLIAIFKVYVTVIRGTPMMVQLLIMGFVIFTSSKNFALVGALTLGINSGAYQAEIIRGGLMSVDAGQMEAGRSLGLGYGDSMRFISVIGGRELIYSARAIVSRTYEAMFPFLGTAAVYLVLVMLFTWLLGLLERRLRASDRR